MYTFVLFSIHTRPFSATQGADEQSEVQHAPGINGNFF